MNAAVRKTATPAAPSKTAATTKAKPAAKPPAPVKLPAKPPKASPAAKVARPVKAAAKAAGKSPGPVLKADGKPALKTGTRAAKAPVLPQAEALPLPVETVVDAVRPAYWDEACADLMKRDRILRKMIPTYGPAHLISRGDPFITLARSVVGQQISVKAAQTEIGRAHV